MSDEIKPALTAEEWADPEHEGSVEWQIYSDGPCHVGCTIEESRYHAMAALCLHGQPFGFTRQDVEFLRSFGIAQMDIAEGPMILSIADRIEALLPPEEDDGR